MNQVSWLTVLISTFVGIVVAAVTWFLARIKTEVARTELSGARVEIARLQEGLQRAERSVSDLGTKRDELQLENTRLATESAHLRTSLETEQRLANEKMLLLSKAEEHFSAAFKNLANDVLERKSERLDTLNEEHLKPLIDPLKEKLGEFQKAVTQLGSQAGSERAVLTNQVERLMELNKELSDDAQNLTLALKGSSKTQGNWGELILERALEISGLQNGREYELRPTRYYEEGNRGQPDVVVNLPEARHLIIDAKVSLTDYAEYVSAATSAEAEAAIRRHVESIRRHVSELSEKEYYRLSGLNSLEVVVMFVPIESALIAAVRADTTLWEQALRKHVLVASPSSLSILLCTVDLLWRREDQIKNVQDIVNRGGLLYDKFAGFVKTLDGVGSKITEAQQAFDEAYGQLKTGTGNAIWQAEMLKRLGARTRKSLPQGLAEEAMQETLIELAAVADLSSQNGDCPPSSDIAAEDEIPF